MEACRAALQDVAASVADVEGCYAAWNTRSFGWEHGPVFSSGAPRPGAWTAVADGRTLHIAPAAYARAELPIRAEGALEDAARPLAGLSSFKNTVQAELRFLDRVEAGATSESVSNATFLIAYWAEVLHALLVHGPLLALNVAKDIVSRRTVRISIAAHSRWIRLVPLRLDALRAEFREVDSMLDLDDLPHGDEAIGMSSIVRVANDVVSAARNDAAQPAVELVLTRLEPLDAPAAPAVTERAYWTSPEEVRVAWRLRAIVAEVEALGVHVRFGTRPLPKSSATLQGTPYPLFPHPPPLVPLSPTSTLNLDVSALIALASDIAHMPLEQGAEHRIAAHPNRALGEQYTHEGQSQLLQCMSDALRAPTTLVATGESMTKFSSIVSTLGSPDEKGRAQALLHGDASSFFRHSRWRDAAIASVLQFPVHDADAFAWSGTFEDDAAAHMQAQRLAEALQTASHAPTRAKTLASSPHTAHSLALGLAQNVTTLTSHANAVTQLAMCSARVAVPDCTAPPSHTAVWLIRPRSFCGEVSSAAVTPETSTLLGAAPERLSEAQDAPDRPRVHAAPPIANALPVRQTPVTDAPPAHHAPAADTLAARQAPVTDVLPLSHNGDAPRGPLHARHPGPSRASTELSHAPRSKQELYPLPFGETPVGATSESPPSPDSSSDSSIALAAPRTRWGKIWRWALGPPVSTLAPIRHYPWWPFARVESSFQRWTAPLSWQAPPPAHLPRWYADEAEAYELLPAAMSRERPPQRGAMWLGKVQSALWHNRIHYAVLVAILLAWLFSFANLVDRNWFRTKVLTEHGWSTPQYLDCTSTFWLRNEQCGLDGAQCAPFIGMPQTFRCPSDCASTTLLNPRTVGDEQYNYKPLVVGGGAHNATAMTPYRADSFVCAAAQHAGVISANGGCGRLRMTGAYANFTASSANGIDSFPFLGVFPSSFVLENIGGERDCEDTRWKTYVLNAVMTALVGIVVRPQPIVLLYILSIVGFWHVNLVSELRDFPPPVGAAAGDFGPHLFVTYAAWRIAFRYVWPAFSHVPIEFGVGTLGLWWIGVLLDVVFKNVPLQRLEAHDIMQQPGGLASLIVVIIVVVCVAINQVRVIRAAGCLPKYLTLYIIAGIAIGLCAAVPGEGVRLHHYVIGIALLPACGFPTRISLLCCALLFGMYTNGVARWGFDGLIQDVGVIQGDATGDSALPSFGTPAMIGSTVHWNAIPPNERLSWDSVVLLVDDVVRYEGTATQYDLRSLYAEYNTTDAVDPAEIASGDLLHAVEAAPHYLRLGYSRGGTAGDFTKPALAWLNGTYIPPPPGRT